MWKIGKGLQNIQCSLLNLSIEPFPPIRYNIIFLWKLLNYVSEVTEFAHDVANIIIVLYNILENGFIFSMTVVDCDIVCHMYMKCEQDVVVVLFFL